MLKYLLEFAHGTKQLRKCLFLGSPGLSLQSSQFLSPNVETYYPASYRQLKLALCFQLQFRRQSAGTVHGVADFFNDIVMGDGLGFPAGELDLGVGKQARVIEEIIAGAVRGQR